MKANNIIVNFLGLIEVVETTAVALYTDFTKFMAEVKIPIKNLLVVGTDEASAICGKNHLFFNFLKDRLDLPRLRAKQHFQLL